MQLVMRRSRLSDGWNSFKINARMVIDADERGILDKYKLHDVTLTHGDTGRDIKKALLFALPIAAVVSFVIVFVAPIGGSSVPPLPGFFVLVFALTTYLIYQQIRVEVRVNDLLNGRDFKARSFIDLLIKEQLIRKASGVFAHVVDQAKTWEEPEVVDLEPQPLFALLEDHHREAA